MTDTRPQDQPDDATIDLIIKQVTEGLSPEEQRALEAMDTAATSAYLRDMERATAAVTLAAHIGEPGMPGDLAQKIAQQAAQHFAAADQVADLGAARVRAERSTARTGSRFGGYGWLAAAACLVLAIYGWQRSPAPPPAPVAAVRTPPVVAPVKPAPPSAAEERTALMANSDSIKISLGATKDPAAAGMTGDVVWDPVAQRGFMHFTGLAANDPAVRQYQIWIFDASRDKRYPVDGGVFDVPAGSNEVVIPIRAILMVRKPAAFAVTVEKPGGVVVSGREHVVALGAIG